MQQGLDPDDWKPMQRLDRESVRSGFESPVRSPTQVSRPAAVALNFMFYNFARVHQTIRDPARMETGVSDHVWSVPEIVALLGWPE